MTSEASGRACRRAAAGETRCVSTAPRTRTYTHDTHTHTNAPASAEAQPSGGHRHQHRASQRCNSEWRRHPLWASCRANYRIKGIRRDGRLSARKPEAGSVVVVVCRGAGSEKIWAKIWLQQSAKAPRNGGAEVKSGFGQVHAMSPQPRRCQRSQPSSCSQRGSGSVWLDLEQGC